MLTNSHTIKIFLALVGILAGLKVVNSVIKYNQITTASIPLKTHHLHQIWVKKYEKTYQSPEELSYRLKIFNDNINFVTDHNSNPQNTFTMKLNSFSDLTFEEFAIKYSNGLAKKDQEISSDEKNDHDVYLQDEHLVQQNPPKVDWTGISVKNTVQKQRTC